MTDVIYESFLRQQLQEGLALSRASDLVELVPTDDELPAKYLARFHCKGLVKRGSTVEVASRFEVGIRFPPDYLRRADPNAVLTWLGPRNVFHPNISDRAPVACIGAILPANPLVDLLYRVWEVITYRKRTTNEFDALNTAACQYARNHAARFPIDPRPLKRQTRHIQALVSERSARP